MSEDTPVVPGREEREFISPTESANGNGKCKSWRYLEV